MIEENLNYEQVLDVTFQFNLPSPPYYANNNEISMDNKIQKIQIQQQPKSVYDTPPTSPKTAFVSTKVEELPPFDVEKFLNVNDSEYSTLNVYDDLTYKGTQRNYELYHDDIMQTFFQNTQPNHHVHKQAFIECGNLNNRLKTAKVSKSSCCQNVETCARQIQKFRRRLQCQKNSRDHRLKTEFKQMSLLSKTNTLKTQITDLKQTNQKLKEKLKKLKSMQTKMFDYSLQVATLSTQEVLSTRRSKIHCC